MYMCIYIYIHMHVYMCTYMCTCVYIYIYIHTYIHTYDCIYYIWLCTALPRLTPPGRHDTIRPEGDLHEGINNQ